MASLAEASYVDISKLGDFLDETVKGALKNPQLDGNFSTSQADEFVQNWEVVYHQGDTGSSGFSGTLFKNKATAEYVYSLRGTEGDQDLFSADYGDIVTDGLAIKQIVDMYNDWQRINTATNQAYQAAYLDLQQTETDLLFEERESNSNPGVVGFYELSLRERTDIVIDYYSGQVFQLEFENSKEQPFPSA